MDLVSGHRIFVGKDTHKFSSAHMTVFNDGSKERLHGHNFQVSVAFDLKHTRFGAMLDFGPVKSTLVKLCAKWDQKLLLAEKCPLFTVRTRSAAELDFTLCGKRYVVPMDEVLLLPLDNVVVETMVEQFARELIAELGPLLTPEVVKGVEVMLTESQGQGARFYTAV
ncbi:MAG: 6-carboxytetrahydropterin synthase [Archangiaceae bacterium]|nr:6-carboxytetrahydropterin synthase [Archangiaceae bacterium]